ncbi:pleiotropic drug resistance 1 [Striga asiatica]|uniref:Pleiotropic drug resistance 1 n=1 Tax=Striga asiatica TaxID=4170 RepID=A0A5A7R6T0_STRAF|nr:pleiotropic drug resistance 1 [Striga asiatica]
MSTSLISLQGRILLHSKLTATCVCEIPRIFLNTTFSTCTAELTPSMQLECGQYCWSMTIGFFTYLMTISSNVMPDARLDCDGAHVLMRTPFSVPAKEQLETRTPRTYSFWGPLPRLPTLMPWPGPQETKEMSTSRVPETMDMQSSPVLIRELEMRMELEEPMRMPSVLGLSAGAVIRSWVRLTLVQAKRLMWGQAAGPSPSRYPPPATVNRLIYRKPIHVSVMNLLGSVGARRVPLFRKAMGPLHGPENVTDPTKYTPRGIQTPLFPRYAHASCHALRNA